MEFSYQKARARLDFLGELLSKKGVQTIARKPEKDTKGLRDYEFSKTGYHDFLWAKFNVREMEPMLKRGGSIVDSPILGYR